MCCLLKQKESEEGMSKAFEVVKEVKDWLGPLTEALCSNISQSEKDERKL